MGAAFIAGAAPGAGIGARPPGTAAQMGLMSIDQRLHGAPSLNSAAVPGARTQELTGLSGTMDIIIAEGRHSHVFHYPLPAAH